MAGCGVAPQLCLLVVGPGSCEPGFANTLWCGSTQGLPSASLATELLAKVPPAAGRTPPSLPT